MKLMNLFMVMLLLTGRAVLAETSSVTDREWLKQQENLSEQLRQHPDKQLQQELEAHGFDLALLAVDLLVDADGGGGELGVARQQRLDRAGDRVLAQRPHGDQLVVQFDELCVETVSHQPNLPVI